MVEIGKVHKVSGSWAVVRFDRKLACENCNMCLKPKEENYVELKVKNKINAKVGDKVKVSMGDRAVITASVIVYVVPLVLVAIAVVVTSLFTTEFVSLIAAIITLVLSFVIVHIIDKKIKTNSAYFPQMETYIEESEEIANTDKKETENE